MKSTKSHKYILRWIRHCNKINNPLLQLYTTRKRNKRRSSKSHIASYSGLQLGLILFSWLWGQYVPVRWEQPSPLLPSFGVIWLIVSEPIRWFRHQRVLCLILFKSEQGRLSQDGECSDVGWSPVKDKESPAENNT